MIFTATSSLLAFQNCSPGYEVMRDPASQEGSSSVVPVTCTLPNGSLLNAGNSVTGFTMMSALSPMTCGTQVQRTCLSDGTFDGTLPLYPSCTQQCAHPDNNQAVNAGSQYTYFTRATAATQAECDAARVVSSCQQSTGLFAPAVAATRFNACTVQVPMCAYNVVAGTSTPTGTTAGSTVTGFQMQSATYPTLCGASVTHSCQASSTWSGAVPLYTACTQQCRHPDNNNAVNAGTMYTYFTRASAATQAECDAARVVSSCNQTTGFFAPAPAATRYASCLVQGQTCAYNVVAGTSAPTGNMTGATVTGFTSQTATSPNLCGTSVTRTCQANGQWNGAVPVYTTCTQQCRHPDNNQAVNANTQYTYFTRATAASQAECDAARVVSTCSQTTGAFAPAVAATRYNACTVQTPMCAYNVVAGTATPTGTTVGSTVTGFATQSATYPALCGSNVTRTCQASSTWSGAVPVYTACVQKCVHPDTNQPVDANAQYVYYTRASGTTAECTAARVTSTCQQSSGLFAPTVASTRFAACQIQDTPPATGDTYKPNDGPVVGANNRVVNVSTAAQLISALAAANPGDVINLAAGAYRLNDAKVRVNRSGTTANPIFIRAANLGLATIEFCNVEGFYVSASNWVFENLVVRGACIDGNNNQHAFHIVGGGTNTIIRNSKVVNFMSHVKVNCDLNGTTFTCPIGIKFLYSRWFNDRPIPGDAPFNVLNIDGSNDAVVRGNIFYDFASANSAKSATAIYPKMHSNNVLVEQNIVVCEKNVVTGSNRRAMNIGDATDGNPNCINGNCKSFNGTFRNNIFMNCQGSGNSFGIGVINQDTSNYLHNTVLNVKHNWFDMIAPAQGNIFKNNLFSQGWASQNSGTVPTLQQNITLTRQVGTDMFVAPTTGNFTPANTGTIQAALQVSLDTKAEYDFCGNKRASMTSVGAIDYSNANYAACVTRVNQLYQQMILD